MRKPDTRQTPCHCIQVRRAAGALTKLYDKALEPVGLTVSQFSLLNDIRALGPCSKSALADYTGLERTTIIRNLGPLRARGLVAEAPATGKRNAPAVQITHAGKAAIAKGITPWQQAQAKAKAAIGPKRLEDFIQTLNSLEALV